MIWRRTALAYALAVFLAAGGAGHAVETVEWEHLAPPERKDTKHPIDDLTAEQQISFYTLFVGPYFLGRSDSRNADEQKAYDALKASGVDPDALLARIRKLREETERRNRTLVRELDRKVVRLAGYALPLDFKGTLVKSFLLVPYVGACIHVPPPPPNQVVYVQADKPFETDELFAPVWVTGPISVGMGNRELELVDGSGDVNFGYSLKATTVEPYERK